MSATPVTATESPPSSADVGLDGARSKRLADLLLEVARCLDRDVAAVLPRAVDEDPRLDALRSVLMEREQAILARLEQKFDNPQEFAEAVGGVLADAFTVAGSRDERLAKVLAPTLEQATQASIRKDPGTLVGILYPLMGPAIRKSIAETLDGTLQGLNQAFKHSFSWRGLKWRLEAFRTGTSFAEVVLDHTVEFRVEHVFLIHRNTGLLLEHVAAPEVAERDPQMVSGMLSAIQDFVRDSFEGAGGGGGIDSLRLGDLLLWTEEGPFAFLAAVIRGNPPDSLHGVLRETLTRIHEDLRIPLDEFDGDTATLGDLSTRLEPCLEQREQPQETRLSPWLWALPLAAVIIVGFWMLARAVEGGRVDTYVELLGDQPGIVVTGAQRRGGQWHVSGLRDPLAVDPAELLSEANLNPERVVGHWESYQALDPAIALARFSASLDPLPGLTLALADGVIRAEGSAPEHWLEQAKELIAAQPVGAPPVDLSRLTDIQEPRYVRLRDAIQSHDITFDSNAPRPSAGQESELDDLAAELDELIQVAGELGFSVRVMIIGHADPTGNETANLSLSAARAEVIRSLLRERGIAPELLLVRSAGTLEPLDLAPGESLAMNRRVTFTVSTAN